jgi:uncharacterized protein (DUF58 family)
VVVTFGVGFAAINTGNNLLFLVLGLMLGLIIVSGILSEVTLRKITVHRKLPMRAEAGVPFSAELAIQNNKRFAASFGVELRDEIDGEPFKRRCFFLRVGAGEQRSVAYRCELTRRGRALFDGTIISTRFPFGLFEKRRFVSLEDDIIVLPARLPVSVPLPFVKEGDGLENASVRGTAGEFREIREMADGDDPRRIHWRSTARLGRPMIRIENADAKGFVELVLDAASSGPDDASMEQVERNIQAAGTIVRDLTRKGLTVRLITSPDKVFEARDLRNAIPLLDHLALLDPVQEMTTRPPRGKSAKAVVIGPRARFRPGDYRLQLPKIGSGKNKVVA